MNYLFHHDYLIKKFERHYLPIMSIIEFRLSTEKIWRYEFGKISNTLKNSLILDFLWNHFRKNKTRKYKFGIVVNYLFSHANLIQNFPQQYLSNISILDFINAFISNFTYLFRKHKSNIVVNYLLSHVNLIETFSLHHLPMRSLDFI